MAFANSTEQTNGTYTHATHYSYDLLGNVHTLIQDYPNSPILDKMTQYDFDLASGKVNQVRYQAGKTDQFTHRYAYDPLNRLIRTQTSPNGIVWETDAEYFYYRHGALARTELGSDKVQGLDYFYTLQGFIKGVNGNSDTELTDLGMDGNTAGCTPISNAVTGMTTYNCSANGGFGSTYNGTGYAALHAPVARDAMSYALQYYQNDYAAIGTSTTAALALPVLSAGSTATRNLYNGNISRMFTRLAPAQTALLPAPFTNVTAATNAGGLGFDYQYDQLNRLVAQYAFTLTSTARIKAPLIGTLGSSYQMQLRYDPNGNITQLKRYAQAGLMDSLAYKYYTSAATAGTYTTQENNPTANTGAIVTPANATNRLAQVTDDISLSGIFSTDIDNQAANNYVYDAIGNLIKDNTTGAVLNITWNIQNKITQVTTKNGTVLKKEIRYAYDALGNRVKKEVFNYNALGTIILSSNATYYTRDAQGNPLATYTQSTTSGVAAGLLHESVTLYGSARLGEYKPYECTGDCSPTENQTTAQNNAAAGRYTRTRGYTHYELTNHLGNVLAVITDRKLISTGAFYVSDVLSLTDYYAFGQAITERTYAATAYRYGFNGKESDREWGDGLTQDYGFRMYNPALGKFLSVDPLTKSYPELTPYQFASNTPIMAIDLDGLEAYVINTVEANGMITTTVSCVFVEQCASTRNSRTNDETDSYKVTPMWMDARIPNIPANTVQRNVTDRCGNTTQSYTPTLKIQERLALADVNPTSRIDQQVSEGLNSTGDAQVTPGLKTATFSTPAPAPPTQTVTTTTPNVQRNSSRVSRSLNFTPQAPTLANPTQLQNILRPNQVPVSTSTNSVRTTITVDLSTTARAGSPVTGIGTGADLQNARFNTISQALRQRYPDVLVKRGSTTYTANPATLPNGVNRVDFNISTTSTTTTTTTTTTTRQVPCPRF